MRKLLVAMMLAAFCWPATPAQAVYRGLLERVDFAVTVDGRDAAVTVSALGPRGRLAVIGVLTASSGQPAVGSFVMGPLVERIVIELDSAPGGTARITIEQGTNRIEDATLVNGDIRYVFDVAD